MRLLKSDYDQRLDDPSTQEVIQRVLLCIRLLLGEGEGLKTPYGLVLGEDYSEPVRTNTQVVSNHRLRTFLNDFNALRIRDDSGRASVAPPRRFRWVIRDKVKFQILVDELATLVTEL